MNDQKKSYMGSAFIDFTAQGQTKKKEKLKNKEELRILKLKELNQVFLYSNFSNINLFMMN